MGRLLALAAMLAATAAGAAAQDPPFITRAEYMALTREISGDAAYEHVRHFTQFHKPRGGSEGLLAVAQYFEARARDAGLEDVRLIRQPATGGAWNARAADLWIGTADSAPPPWSRLVSLRQTPLHLADGSESADVTADLVDVGAGADSSDYVGREVRGKVVLAWGPIAAVAREAVTRRGAAGILSRPNPQGAQALDYPDQVRWSFTPGPFAFVLSHRQGTELARTLARGRVAVRAHVETVTDTSQHWQVMVEGVIRGTQPSLPAVVLTAHLQEEKFSANDDGSGVANLAEIARAFTRLISTGQIPRPRRTIRFWWVTEIGSERQYFADNPDEARRVWLNINQDMAGANQAQDVMRVQNITYVPWTRAHFLDDVALRTIEFLVTANSQQLASAQVPAGTVPWRPAPIYSTLGTRHRYNAAMVPFHSNTDHITFVEAPIGVPGITFTNWPDNYIHTSDDDLWNVDRTQLERNAVAEAMMALFLARAGDPDAPALVAATSGRAMARIADAYRLAAARLLRADTADLPSAYKAGRWHIEAVAAVATQHVRSVSQVASGSLPNRLVARAAAQVDADGRARVADLDLLFREVAGRPAPAILLSPVEQRLDRMRPSLSGGPREFQERRGRVDGVDGLHNLMAGEIVNAVDGRRTGLDIYKLVSAEARAGGDFYYGVVTPEAVEQYLQNLVRAELVRM